MRKSNSFKVPEKYFENIDVEILEKLKFKKNVFTFPQNYFENIDSEKIIEIENIALKAHQTTGCRGITRSDFRYYKNKFYLLEINTQPGMTELSLVPEIAKFKGISFYNLIKWMIKDASLNR